MNRESKETLLLAAGLLFTTFMAIHVDCCVKFSVMYGSTLIVLSYVAWQMTKVIRKCLVAPKRLSPHNKAVLITGCDTGFGYHLARRLYEEGYIVFAACLSASGDGANDLRSNHDPERMHVFQMDVTKDADVADAVTEVKSKLTEEKVLWAIVNNAGIGSSGLVEMESMESFERHIAVNQLGVVRVTKAFLPFIRRSQGRVVNVASVTGRVTSGGLVPYSMTKHAVVSFSDGLRRELWEFGVRVISIEPAVYRTTIIPPEEVIRSILEEKWKSADPEIREFYGDQCLTEMIEQAITATKKASPNINDVVETMVYAVTAEDPDDVNRVVPNFIERLGFWLVIDVLPVKLQSLFIALTKRDCLPIDWNEYVKKEFGI